jgi:hypothetical protein
MANKNTEPVSQQEEDTIQQPQTPTAQQTHTITTNTIAQVAQQPQQRNIFGRLLSMIPISPNLFTKSNKDKNIKNVTPTQENKPTTSERTTNSEQVAQDILEQRHILHVPQRTANTNQEEVNQPELNKYIPQRGAKVQQQMTYQPQQTTWSSWEGFLSGLKFT